MSQRQHHNEGSVVVANKLIEYQGRARLLDHVLPIAFSRTTICRLLLVVEQRHESEVHVQLLMAVKEREARIVCDEVDVGLLVPVEHENVLHQSCHRLSRVVCDLESMAVQMNGM